MMLHTLTHTEARARSAVVSEVSYDVAVDVSDEKRFRSNCTVRFTARAGETTFVDIAADRIARASFNGEPLPTDDAATTGRILLPSLLGRNELVVESEHAYSRTGEGLHRFVDPEDGGVYLHTQFEPEHAHTVFACFDQPDLRGSVRLSVRAPSSWTTVANTPEVSSEEDGDTRTVVFAPTRPLSPYMVAFCTGDYVRVDGTDVGVAAAVYCRRSRRHDLDADEVFAITTAGLRWFEEFFGVSYPWGKYDQVFAPEFSAGAMENPGCVTLSEDKLFAGAPTAAQRERRALHILHEMAHMWFGDLVTMAWWDDLWLKEAFAEFVSVLCQAEVTEWTGAWTTFTLTKKPWAFEQDQRAGAHPVIAAAENAAEAEANFDGITYVKGASALRQLYLLVGRERFRRGVRHYLRAHAYDSAAFTDLLAAFQTAPASSAVPPIGWAEAWLRTSGPSTLTAARTATGIRIGLRPAAGSDALPPHRIRVGVYERTGQDSYRCTRHHDLTVDAAATAIAFGQVPSEALVIVDDDDWTYARVLVDPDTREHALASAHRVADEQARASLLTGLWQQVRDGEISTDRWLRLTAEAAPAETSPAIRDWLLGTLRTVLNRFTAPDALDAVGTQIRDIARHGLDVSPGTEAREAWFDLLVEAGAVADLVSIEPLLDGAAAPVRLTSARRWLIITRLAALGRIDRSRIDAELRRTPGVESAVSATQARAALPSPEDKESAWADMVDTTTSLADVRAIVRGIVAPLDPAVGTWIASRYVAFVTDGGSRSSIAVTRAIATGLFPVQPGTLPEAERRTLEQYAGTGADAALRRIVQEGLADADRGTAVARRRDPRA